VFDCDGLLMASTACWTRAYAVLAENAGRRISESMLSALAGASVVGAAKRLSRELGCAVSADDMRRALAIAIASDPPQPLPGAQALTGALAAHLPLAVATNGPADLVVGMLERAGLAARFQTIVSAEDTAADKPAPDVYLEACRRLGVHPSDAVAFEDSPRGVRSAQRAGLTVVGVPSERGTRLDVDLAVGRLDDPRLVSWLGLAGDPRSWAVA
jgi:HAD superfamily hydrolase (TIGR01509 family)